MDPEIMRILAESMARACNGNAMLAFAGLTLLAKAPQEAPQVEVPKIEEVPQVEAPQVEAPQVEAPKLPKRRLTSIEQKLQEHVIDLLRHEDREFTVKELVGYFGEDTPTKRTQVNTALNDLIPRVTKRTEGRVNYWRLVDSFSH